jgi:hypothetical protein
MPKPPVPKPPEPPVLGAAVPPDVPATGIAETPAWPPTPPAAPIPLMPELADDASLVSSLAHATHNTASSKQLDGEERSIGMVRAGMPTSPRSDHGIKRAHHAVLVLASPLLGSAMSRDRPSSDLARDRD